LSQLLIFSDNDAIFTPIFFTFFVYFRIRPPKKKKTAQALSLYKPYHPMFYEVRITGGRRGRWGDGRTLFVVGLVGVCVSGVGATASKKKRKKAVRSFVLLSLLTLLTLLTRTCMHIRRHRHFYPLFLATIHIALFMSMSLVGIPSSKTALFCATVPQRLSIHNINDGRPTRQSRRRQIETN
jgi:hypothetical protein